MASLPDLPPRCLNAFGVRRITAAEVGLFAPAAFSVYLLACPCGHDQWRMLGNWFEDTTHFIGPLFAECLHCDTRLRMINTATDGYDAEIGAGIDEEETPHVVWVCGNCGASEGGLAAAFGYHYEPDEEDGQHHPDYFDAFILTHFCPTSHQAVQVAMIDCA